MKLEITNASYSTALTFELVDQYDLQILGAPAFPSLKEEAFYEANVNKPTMPLFIQYKLGEYFIGNTSSLKDFWGVPYYRFQVHPKNKMRVHKLLLNLEAMNQLVFYTAPEFHTMNEFYNHLMQRTLLNNSTFWAPQAIGTLLEDQRYFISYKSNTNFEILQPGHGKIDNLIKGERLLDVVRHKFESNQFDIYDDDKLFQFGDEMLENYLKVFYEPKKRELIEDIKKGRERIDPRDYLSMIAILLYDCYVYMITAT